MGKEIVPGILRLVTMLFKYLKNGMRKKIVPVIFKFLSMHFLNIWKFCHGISDLQVGFFKYLKWEWAKKLSQVFSDS